MPDDVGVTDAALDAAREAGRQEGLEQAAIEIARLKGGLASVAELLGSDLGHFRRAEGVEAFLRGEKVYWMEAAYALPDHEDVRGILGDPPHATPAQALGGAECALEMCAAAMNAETAFSGALAKAAVIAYLSLTGRDAESEKVSHVDI